MRDTGRAIGRLSAPAGWVVLAAAIAAGVAACGGGDDSSATAEREAMEMPAAGEAGGGEPAMNAPAERPAASATMPQELPEGVTPAMVSEGKQIYGGAGICFSCHGPEGKGVPNLGADLTDGQWAHSDGGYESIVQTVTNGVSAEKSSSGVPMPPKGGSSITDAQVRAVAAYVWTLSHGGQS